MPNLHIILTSQIELKRKAPKENSEKLALCISLQPLPARLAIPSRKGWDFWPKGAKMRRSGFEPEFRRWQRLVITATLSAQLPARGIPL